ncbi:hypothetical protein RhiJN_03178 [Ceratobasidium sp. AG-Ba]|nr:hypothetical protein RhiJN_03178 [Ceratobasidium sp. AG-Ba]
MASGSKKVGKANVNASSFFDLKAELAKHEDAFAKSKLVGKGRVEPIVGGVKKDKDKKPPAWARQNKGVKDRARRDAELEQVSKPTLESARAALERKAQIYDKLQRGKGGGLSEKQREALLVDFDDRYDDGSSGDGSDRDESLVVPRPPNGEPDEGDPDDPIIEYEDEFGRIRTARRSDVPRDRLPETSMTDIPADDESTITNATCFRPTKKVQTSCVSGSPGSAHRHALDLTPPITSVPLSLALSLLVFADGRATHFPVYEPTAEKRAEVELSLLESSPFARYDASKDNRATGAGFYQFSADEETRARQMEELKQARVDTVIARAEAEADAEDRPALGGAEVKPRSRAIEKRRKELDERRQMLETKRRKLLGISGEDDTTGADDFLASLERDLLSAPAKA